MYWLRKFILYPALFSIHLVLSGSYAFALDDADKNKCKSTDLVLIIDTTYSLSRTIYNIKLETEELLNQLNHVAGGQLRLGLVSFKDDITIHEDLDALPTLQDKRRRIDEKVFDLRATGGGAGPEASDEALRTVIHGLSAEGRAQNKDFSGRFEAETKIIVLVTDNRPGGFDDKFVAGVDDDNAATRAFEASEQGIMISSIYIPTSFYDQDEITENIMRDYALITGGLFIKIDPSGEGAAEAISGIIDSCGRRPMV